MALETLENMKQIATATKTVLFKKLYLIGFLILIPLVFSIFVLIPVWTIPGNSLDFQLGIFSERDYLILSTLSLLTSLSLVMQIFIFRNSIDIKSKTLVLGKSSTGGFVAAVGSVFTTAACGSCLFALFGFLGFGTLIFLLQHQWYILSGAIIFLIISLYFASKKINGICDVCNMDIKKSGK